VLLATIAIAIRTRQTLCHQENMFLTSSKLSLFFNRFSQQSLARYADKQITNGASSHFRARLLAAQI
jgi:hypothetical protein